jgi:predicted O-linked N-acetylglucosamine transferase (SPINDLY family)
MKLQIDGQLQLAEQLYRSILQANPAHAVANHCLGMLHLQLQRPAEGLPYLLLALNAHPEIPDYWLGYLEALFQSGQIDAARDALALGRQHGLSGAAVEECAKRLLPRVPQPAASDSPSPRTPAASDSPPASISPASRAATAAQPSNQAAPEPRAARRRLARAVRRQEDALLVVRPQDDALLALVGQRRFAEGLLLARSMTERFPEHGLGWKILGALLWAEGCADEAIVAMHTSTRLMPQDAEAHSNLGMSFAAMKRFGEAEAWLRKALAIDPTFAAAHYRLGMYYELQARYAEAEASFRAAIALRSDSLSTDDEQGYSNLLYVTSHNPNIDADALFAEHCRVGDIFEGDQRAARPRHTNLPDPERRLQVGFVSGDFRDHSVATFLEPVVKRLAQRPTLELHAYSNHAAEDRVTARLRRHFKHWNPVSTLSDIDLTRKIIADRIDILIDLSGHTALNRLRAFARKPAPIQAGWLGYPATTGLQAMDYYLADRHWLPPGKLDRLFTEKLVYLPDRWAFEPHPTAPAVSALPALETGHLTFGSFHRLGKINASTIHLWSRLLLALPQAALLVAGLSLDDQQNPLREQFAAQGIPPERLRFHGRCNMDEYLALHHHVDIGLDTHPYAGATTTMHSLSMGVPTLTLAGASSTARAGAGILGQVGLDGFIAADAADFVEKGLYWAHHLDELALLRQGLRTRLQQSPSGHPDLIAAHLEGALRHMWRRWCAGLPAESFDSVALRPDA